jgi:hypothetical protein
MADNLKVLGQTAPSATTETILYTAPSGVQTTTSSLVVCNRGTASGTFRVAVRPKGAALSNLHYLYYDTAICANDTEPLILGMTLQETDVVAVYASTANFSFTLFGVETS